MNGTPAERLQSGLVRQANGCLEWTRYTNPKGYGQIEVDGKKWLTHCFAWVSVNGPIPDDLYVLHHCDNPPCCQAEPTEGYPEGHLFLGTKADNNADMVAKGRQSNGQRAKTHCPDRHEYTEANTYVDSRGYRHCRVCVQNAKVRYRRKRRAAGFAQRDLATRVAVPDEDHGRPEPRPVKA